MSVLVTGATGYIATHIVDQLLEMGYPVIGSARSMEKAQPILDAFKEKYPSSDFKIAVVPEIDTAGAFDDVFKTNPDIKYVMHTASPAAFDIEGDLTEKFLNPAVNGAVGCLKSAKEFGKNVETFVMTSSVVACLKLGGETVETFTYKDWNPLPWEVVNNTQMAYMVSKTYAEKAAREFVEKESPKFKFVTVNPNFVLGPQVFDFQKISESPKMFFNVLKSTEPFTSSFCLWGHDVRDVAKFHILAITKEGLDGARLLISNDLVVDQNILDVVNEAFPDLGIIKGTPGVSKKPDFLIDATDASERVGGFEYIDMKKTYIDSVTQYLRVHDGKIE